MMLTKLCKKVWLEWKRDSHYRMSHQYCLSHLIAFYDSTAFFGYFLVKTSSQLFCRGSENCGKGSDYSVPYSSLMFQIRIYVFEGFIIWFQLENEGLRGLLKLDISSINCLTCDWTIYCLIWIIKIHKILLECLTCKTNIKTSFIYRVCSFIDVKGLKSKKLLKGQP